uniref:Glutaredoxin domain-containing protein n=1 Tax=Leersia perrieri TaxID=77586 RepID=A0A0D9VQ15_9ORYZ
MGCTTSRQARHDLRHCPPSPLPLPLPLPRCRSFPARCATVGDAVHAGGVHVVRLTSSTLGSLDADKAAAAEPPASCRKVTPLPDLDEEKKPAASRRRKEAVLYFTSLRGVRATHEACCAARAILRGYGVRVDERDVSMHRGFRDELSALLLGAGGKRLGPVLPSLFVDGEMVGNAEEVKRLHEAGELAARLDGCEVDDAGGEDGAGACEACADVRFVLCEVCSGSCKVYVDDDDGGDEEEEEEENPLDGGGGGGGFRRCTECNENGIVRCPVCCC